MPHCCPSAWRQGIAPLVGLWPLLGLALALIAAGVLGWQVGKANGLEALAWMVVASFVAGIAGLAVSRGLVF